MVKAIKGNINIPEPQAYKSQVNNLAKLGSIYAKSNI